MLCEECRECPSREKTMSKKTSLKDRKHGDGDKGDEIDRLSKKRRVGIWKRKMNDWHWHEHNAIGIDIFQQGVLQSTLETIELWRKRFDARGN